MLFCINKYFRRAAAEVEEERKHQQKQQEEKMVDTLSPCIKDASQICTKACCATPFLGASETGNPRHRRTNTTTTTTRATRSEFSKATTSSLFPNTQFTNHESLPSLPDAFSSFTAAYPKYDDTHLADSIRNSEYHHLTNHVCLDYSGFSIFSHAQMNSSIASSSSSAPPLQPPFFDISYKSASLNSQMRYGNPETLLESAIRKRIMSFLNISGDEYAMVCTANRTTAFKLLAESYPFQSNKRLLTVYDYESEAVKAMTESAQKRGARAMSASFSWPSLRIYSAKLRKMVSTKKKRRGLFVFPLQSRMTGARYPYLWMSLAQENGWHVVLDAGALGPKDLDTLGISLIQPDFIVCSFFKVFGENPSGFAGLFIKKTSAAVLESSTIAKSIGVVSIVPSRRLSQLQDDFSGTDLDAQPPKLQSEEDSAEITSSFSGPMHCNGSARTDDVQIGNPSSSEQMQAESIERDGSSEQHRTMADIRGKGELSPEIMELEKDDSVLEKVKNNAGETEKCMVIECRGLDHADALGLLLISSRLRYITNWLVMALMKLRHPHSENGHSLVRIYGPRVKFDRAPALAFSVFDWKGEKIEPVLVQKLADRSNISLSCGFLHNIWFSDNYEEQKDTVLERRIKEITVGNRRKENVDLGINVVSASIGFLTNFEDAYRLWAFVAKFLDADFVEKERWRYMALNQNMIEV